MMAARHENGRYQQKKVSKHFLASKGQGLSNAHVGVSRDTVFGVIRPGAGFKTGDLVKEHFNLVGGGATTVVERLFFFGGGYR